ncbi:hypothetical protein ACIG5E_19060 [Kitasatospora sp. NPDC053057]|uniref:hypothetical protein n=1 Tax=Kitasatospora sp. NPDC053057 TaxID=3364062 RepID=UPI0037C77F0D
MGETRHLAGPDDTTHGLAHPGRGGGHLDPPDSGATAVRKPLLVVGRSVGPAAGPFGLLTVVTRTTSYGTFPLPPRPHERPGRSGHSMMTAMSP